MQSSKVQLTGGSVSVSVEIADLSIAATANFTRDKSITKYIKYTGIKKSQGSTAISRTNVFSN